MKKDHFKNKCKKATLMAGSAILMAVAKSQSVLASSGGGMTTGIPQIDNILNTLKLLFIGIVGGIGLIILIKSIGDTAQAYQERDSHGMYDGARGIAAGAIMVFIGAVLSVLGL